MKRIEIDSIVMSTGTPSVIQGQGGVVNSERAEMWFDVEVGMLFIKPKGANQILRMFHPANIEMRPKAGQLEQAAPPPPAPQKKTQTQATQESK